MEIGSSGQLNLRDIIEQLGLSLGGSNSVPGRGLGLANHPHGGPPGRGLEDALQLSQSPHIGAEGTFQLVNLQVNVAITRVTGVTTQTDQVIPPNGLGDAAQAAENILNFAGGLFDVFRAQNEDLDDEEAADAFRSLVRTAVNEGIADAERILDGLGRLNDESRGLVDGIRERLEAFLEDGLGEVEDDDDGAGIVSRDGLALPSAQDLGITRVEQVSVNVSLQVARTRISTRGAEATGQPAPTNGVNLLDVRGFDELVEELTALTDELFNDLLSGEDLFGGEGLGALVDRVLEIVGAGFDDASRILDGFGVGQLTDGSTPGTVFEAAFDSIELNVQRTRIETADGLVFEQTSLSLSITQVRIQASVGEGLAPDQPLNDLALPESPGDVAENILDFASELFGAFRAQNPQISDTSAVDRFLEVVREAAAEGARQAEQILDGLNRLDDDSESEVEDVLTSLEELIAERFPALR